MFGTNHFCNRARIHPRQDIQPFGALPRHDAVQDRVGFVFTQRQAHDAIDIVRATQAHAVLFFQHIDKLVEHHVHSALRQRRSLHHGCAQCLYFFGAEVFHNFSRLFFTQQQHQHSSPLGRGHGLHFSAKLGGPLDGVVFSHVVSLVACQSSRLDHVAHDTGHSAGVVRHNHSNQCDFVII